VQQGLCAEGVGCCCYMLSFQGEKWAVGLRLLSSQVLFGGVSPKFMLCHGILQSKALSRAAASTCIGWVY